MASFSSFSSSLSPSSRCILPTTIRTYKQAQVIKPIMGRRATTNIMLRRQLPPVIIDNNATELKMFRMLRRSIFFCGGSSSSNSSEHKIQQQDSSSSSSFLQQEEKQQKQSSQMPQHKHQQCEAMNAGVLMSSMFPSMLTNGVGMITGFLFLSVLTTLYIQQEKMLYIPEIENSIPRKNIDNPIGYRNPLEYNINYKEHFIETDDGVTIHSWLLLHPDNSKQNKKPTIVFFHGNAGNIGIRLPNAKQMIDNLECNVFLVEYRGYGDSDDVTKITEKGMQLDSEAALRFIGNYNADNEIEEQEDIIIDANQIIVFGRSLGGAVAFHLLSKIVEQCQEQSSANNAVQKFPPVAGIIVENTFLSIDKMVDAIFPIVISPFKFLILRMHWNSESILTKIQKNKNQLLQVPPILYLAGDCDEIVPHSHMKELYKHSIQSKNIDARIHIIKGGTHNETWMQGGLLYWKEMKQFIIDVTTATKSK